MVVLSDYIPVDVLVNLEQVEEPEHAARPVQDVQVRALCRDISERRFHNHGNTTISVVERDPPNDRSRDNVPVYGNGVMKVAAWLVDGRHRKRSMESVASGVFKDREGEMTFTEEQQSHAKDMMKSMKATLWLRRDKKAVTMHEVLGLSNYFNEVSGNVLKTSFGDKLFSASSALRLFQKLNNIEQLSDVPLSQVSDMVTSGRLLGTLSAQQTRKYVQVAFICESSGKCKERVYDLIPTMREKKDIALGSGIGLVHLLSNTLSRDYGEVEFSVAMLALGNRLRRTKRGAGHFENIREVFYQETKEFVGFVREIAIRQKKDVEELLKLKPATEEDEEDDCFDEAQSLETSLANIVSSIREEKTPSDSGKKVRRRQMREVLVQYFSEQLVAEVLGDRLPKRSGQSKTKPKPVPETPSDDSIDMLIEEVEEVMDDEQVPGLEVESGEDSEGDGDSPNDKDESDDESASSSDDEPPTPVTPKKAQRRTSGHQTQANAAAVTTPSRKAKAGQIAGKTLPRLGKRRRSSPDYYESQSESEEEGDDVEEVDVSKEAPAGSSRTYVDDIPTQLPYGCEDPAGSQVQNLSPQQEKDLWRLMVQGPVYGSGGEDYDKRWDIFPSGLLSVSRLVHIPAEHRINVFAGSDAEVMVRSNLESIYFRAAMEYMLENPLECVCPGNHALANKGCGSVGDVGGSYLMAKRAEIKSAGFCVFGGILKDNIASPDAKFAFSEDATGNDLGKNWYHRLVTFYQEHFEECERRGLGDDESQKFWNMVTQSEKGVEHELANGNGLEGRWISTNTLMMEHVEEKKETVWVAKYRAYLDLRLGQLLAALRLAPNCGEGVAMMVPKTGGRWLVCTKKCKRQILHTDFSTSSAHITEDRPGYFLICTGTNEAPVWVVEGSHLSVKRVSFENARALGRGSVERKVYIPPYSVFVGRGDLFHAGYGMEGFSPNGRLVYGKQSLRYHIYCVPEEYELPNGIHTLKQFSDGVTQMEEFEEGEVEEEEENEETS